MEDFKKKYNEALDWMRKIYPTLMGANKEDAEHYFPELKESEDERIRTRLIALVEAFGQGEYKNEMLAYLEKHKDSPMPEDTVIFQKGVAEGRRLEREEQQPAEGTALQKAFMNSKIDYTLEEKCDASEYAEAILPTSVTYGENEEEYKLHKIIEAAFIAGQKKEQKPAEYINITQKILDYIDKDSKKYENKRPVLGDAWVVTKKHKFPNAFNGKPVVEVEKEGFGWMVLPEEIVEIKSGKKKLAEWSEEDKVTLNNIIRIIHMKSIKPLDEMDARSKYEKYEDFLKSLPTRFSLQSKAEWSEEDEKMIDLIIAIFKVNHPNGLFKANKLDDSNISVVYTEKIVAWLKSLRPQLHWKPSKEQMRCLLDCVSKAKEIHNASVGGYDAYHILVSLYDELHKLLLAYEIH